MGRGRTAPNVLDHYEQLLGTFKTLGEDIRRRIDAGEI
jgi:hypothetical protein